MAAGQITDAGCGIAKGNRMYGAFWSWRGALAAALHDVRERAPRTLAPVARIRPPKGIGAREGVAALAIVLSLAACSTIDDLFSDSPPPANSKSGDYPKLNTVPGRPDRPTPPAGLSGDRSNARYTDSDVKPVNEAANAVVGQQLTASATPPAGSPATTPAAPVDNSVQPAPVSPQAPSAGAPQSAVPPRNGVAMAPVTVPATPSAMPAPMAASGPVGLPAPIPPSATQLVLPSPSGSRAGAPVAGPVASAAPTSVPFSGNILEVAVVQFGRSSSGLDGSALSVLRDVASIQRSQGGVIRIVGHSSSDSASADPDRARQDAFNVSMARANAVARQLIALGVPRNQIVVESAADSQPEYAPLTATAVAANRRAEIFLDL
jgi:outer membrane protein OmpA-like peptidoglycan-associated protein